jgi:hypothetical protein
VVPAPAIPGKVVVVTAATAAVVAVVMVVMVGDGGDDGGAEVRIRVCYAHLIINSSRSRFDVATRTAQA